MGLATALEENRGIRKGPRCSVCVLREELSPEDRDALDAALADSTFTAAGISRALKAEGFDVLSHTLQRHRRSECRS